MSLIVLWHFLEEFARLKAACKDDRERAIVLTLAGTGMRVNELCNLMVEDLDFEHGYIHIEVAKESPQDRSKPKACT